MKNIVENKILELINTICSIYEMTFSRSRMDFTNGYCFYFAVILKEILPECQFCYMQSHYFIKLGDVYYDYRGIIPSTEEGLIIYDEPILFKNLYIIDDLQNEYYYANHIGLVDPERDKIVKQYKDFLVQTGKNILQTSQESKNQKNRTLN